MGGSNEELLARRHTRHVERYYDFIYHWTQLTNRFKAFANPGSYAIHRGLVDPLTGEFSTDTVHRMIAECVTGRSDLRGLDAGCGYAGTLIELEKRLGGHLHGITISQRQVRVAKHNLEKLGLQNKIKVSLHSFDHPITLGYDVVFGIESLIHSERPAVTIDNLVRSLRPGGTFIIVDDMPAPQARSALADDLRAFKRTWHCPVMPSSDEWSRHLQQAGCEIIGIQDLTEHMRPRPENELRDELENVARKRRWRDRIGLRLVSDAQEGGLRLERLTREGAVRYVMLSARKSKSV